MHIYTKGGDKGTTRFISGEVVGKDDLRIEAYGTYDEVNSILGVAKSHMNDKKVQEIVSKLQNDLFTVCAELAQGTKENQNIPIITKKHVAEIEQLSDDIMNTIVLPKSFVVPGGTKESAYLDYARTIARRAERHVVRLSKNVEIRGELLQYLNRLSDALYLLARLANNEQVKEQQPIYRYLNEEE